MPIVKTLSGAFQFVLYLTNRTKPKPVRHTNHVSCIYRERNDQ